MISSIYEDDIEIKNAFCNRIFKHVGQIIKAYVQEKISKELYLIRFFKSAVLVKSRVNLKEGEQIFLKVESLRPKIVLKKVSPQKTKTEHLNKSFSIFKEISPITQDLIKGTYIQFPFFCSNKDAEFFFFKDSDKKEEKYIIRIKVELSLLGTVDIFVEDTSAATNIVFGVENKQLQDFFMKKFYLLHDILKRNFPTKNISVDCRVLPKEYLDVPLYSIVENKGVSIFV